jgi:hypothetical protein
MPNNNARISGGDRDGNRRNVSLPYTLTVIATYRCTAACEHCCFQSNPYIQGRVPQDRLIAYIDQAAEIGSIQVVCFSGGEPFLLGQDLVELVERCSRHGLLTRVVTNGYWAVNDDGTRLWLSNLVEAGLNEINFSTGDDHQKFVPLERIVRGMAISLEFGLTQALMIEDRLGRAVGKQTVLDLAVKYPDLNTAIINGEVSILESPWMEFSTDGYKIEQHQALKVNSANVHLREPCKSVLSTIVVTPSEQLGVCCGLPRQEIPELHAGDLKMLPMKQLIDKALSDFINIWLFVEGPEKILAWAAQHDTSIEWEDKYAHNCDACRAIFKDSRVMTAIRKYHHEKLNEILMRFAAFQHGNFACEEHVGS